MERKQRVLFESIDSARARVEAGVQIVQVIFDALRLVGIPVLCIEVRSQVEHPEWGAVSWVATRDGTDERFIARRDLPELGSGEPRAPLEASWGPALRYVLADGGRGRDVFWAWPEARPFDADAATLLKAACGRIAVDAALLAQRALNQTQIRRHKPLPALENNIGQFPIRVQPPLDPDVKADRRRLLAIAKQFGAFDRVRTPFWVFHPYRYQLVWGNQAAQQLWKADDLEQLWRRDLRSSMSHAMAFNIYETTERLAREGRHMEWAILEPLGEPKRFCLIHHYTEIVDGTPAMLTEALTEPPAEQIVNLAANLALTLALFDEEGDLISSNTSFLRLMGERRFGIRRLLREGWDPAYFIQQLSLHEPHFIEVALPTQRGERWFRIELRRTRSIHDEVRVLGSFFDITEQRIEQLELKRLATTDLLTGLSNRHGLMAKLHHALEPDERWTFIFLDLDGLKMINDVHGHGFGDQILAAAGRRMAGEVPPEGFIGRMGGDEFLLVLPGQDAEPPEVIRKALAQPFDIEGVHLTVTASLGVAYFPQDGEDIEGLITHADMATLHAKRGGKNQVIAFEPSMIPESYRSRELNRHIRTALVHDELRLVVQPVVGLGERALRGECLMRWRSRSLGVVSPAEFIPAAEEAGIMPMLGRFLVERTCELLHKVRAASGRWIPLSVNVSARELTDPQFAERFLGTLREHGIPRELLSVELTETSLLHHLDRARESLAALQRGGVQVALDDFGTGYSSLSYLHQLSFDFIKLDRSLVEGLPGARGVAITRAVIGLARDLGANVVGEGIETQEQLDALRSLGCHYGQGFLLSRPLEVPDWIQFTRAHHRDPEP